MMENANIWMSTPNVDASQSCRALLQNLNEDYQIVPMLKTALQRGWSASFMNSLNGYIDEKQHSIQEICNKNYMQFCDSMDKVITMRKDVGELSKGVSSFHEEISFTGLKALKEAQRLISLKKTSQQVEKALADITVFDNLLSLVERADKLVVEEKYYLALKTLDTLKASLQNLPPCRLTRNLEAYIKPQTEDILNRCRQSFFKWCREIQPICQMIGEASMIRAFNRKQQDGSSKTKKEGVEDVLEKVDLSIVYEYQHVFEHAGRINEFRTLYSERREPQCDFEVLASKNLKSMPTPQFITILNGLLYSSIGYFYIEDVMQRGSLLYSDATHMQTLFNTQLQVLVEALQYHLRLVTNVDDLLSIETSVWTYGDVMSGQPLLFNVESIYDMGNDLVEQSIAIIKGSALVEMNDAIENERYELYKIHSAEDFFGVIAKYQLLDEPPAAYPYECEFTAIVPTVLQIITNSINRLILVMTSLGVTESFNHQYSLVSSIIDSLITTITDMQEEIEEEEIAKMAIVSMNWGALAKSVDSLQRILLSNDDTESTSMSLEKKKQDLITQQSRMQDNMMETIQNKCDEMMSDLEEEGILAPSSPSSTSHPCIMNLITYLKETFSTIHFLSHTVIEACQFSTCRHIAQHIQTLLTEGEGYINVAGIFDLNLDLLAIESFVEELDVLDLVQCFTDVQQLLDLLLSGDIKGILDDDIHNTQYPLVAMPILIGVLERIKEIKKLPLVGKKMMIPSLKKKEVDIVLESLREMYE